MTQATVKTVQFLDPRIEPQPDPVYDYVVGPIQNQYYRIPASGLSESNITFNNLTTLGIDRAYLDTFELEINAIITFNLDNYDLTDDLSKHALVPAPDEWTFQSWPFATCCDEARVNINGASFFSQPMCYVRAKERYMKQADLAKCYENICPCHKPIMQYELPSRRDIPDFGQEYNKTGYEYVDAPANPPTTTNRLTHDRYPNLALKYFAPVASYLSNTISSAGNASPGVPNGFLVGTTGAGPIAPAQTQPPTSQVVTNSVITQNIQFAYPSRYGAALYNYMQSAQGVDGGFNNSIVTLGAWNETKRRWTNYYRTNDAAPEGSGGQASPRTVVKVSWREPVFCSPFSSKYDATYGRPLYNITSMDLSFNLQNLGNMIRVSNLYSTLGGKRPYVKSYSITFESVNLCYQVMTIPSVLTKPLTTLVPYRRFVPYITQVNEGFGRATEQKFSESGTIDNLGKVTIPSGVYTFNEIPTAIWLFVAPVKSRYQTNEHDNFNFPANAAALYDATTSDAVKANCGCYADDVRQGRTIADVYDTAKNNCYNSIGNWDSNKLFAYITNVNISMANTTQILATASQYDLYRIAKANGCQDSFASWGGLNICDPKHQNLRYAGSGDFVEAPEPFACGAGSVLRLKPGVDLIVPDQALIPGANANNMVFNATVEAHIPPHSASQSSYALWFLFEYVGVAAISPGQCEITMNPLGSGEVMAVSPVMSATSESTEGEVEGSGFWDRLKKLLGVANQKAQETGIVSKLLRAVDNKYADVAADAAEKMGYGAPKKRARGGACSGGAVIGKGLNDWV